MSIQMNLPDVFVDLSTEEQQLLTGGQSSDLDFGGKGGSDDDDEENPTRRYKVRSIAIVSLTKLR